MESGDVVELAHERAGGRRTTSTSGSAQLSVTSASALTSQDSSVGAMVMCVPSATHTGWELAGFVTCFISGILDIANLINQNGTIGAPPDLT